MHSSCSYIDVILTPFSGVQANIIQIAAKELKSGQTFDTYVDPPNGFIPRPISKLTDIEMHGRKMYHRMIPVTSADTKTALGMFRDWLKQFSGTLLIAHNAQFDSKAYSCDLHDIVLPNVVGFGDTLSLFRQEFPGRAGTGGYSPPALVKDLLQTSYDANKAIGDVTSLAELVGLIENFENKLTVVTVEEVRNRIRRLSNEKKYMNTYTEFVNRNIISKAKAIAASGLSQKHIEVVNTRSGVEGLSILLRGIVPTPDKVATELHSAFMSV